MTWRSVAEVNVSRGFAAEPSDASSVDICPSTMPTWATAWEESLPSPRAPLPVFVPPGLDGADGDADAEGEVEPCTTGAVLLKDWRLPEEGTLPPEDGEEPEDEGVAVEPAPATLRLTEVGDGAVFAVPAGASGEAAPTASAVGVVSGDGDVATEAAPESLVAAPELFDAGVPAWLSPL
jgi:hypothetical protein